ncbi:MaoC/PaaZ C-terminal domain-containing protein [Desmospora profundinema]|uniref:Acyl dehydratase n=1 Tax=Desmospora profundinema TaxID=1571184 RepID=A0ABU1ILM8_9BACL|nr:MaoC/PaaZ C-terminal domain-containing protein [Desmospora profundinema]MDR6225687.1 acyl dehydratase [Desmospora profundinema]
MTEPLSVHWETGDRLKSITLPPVTRMELIQYAGVSGDFNPIHTIDEEAEKAGLPGVIAHGMLTMAKISRYFSRYLENGWLQHFHTRFDGMVFVGDVLTIDGSVVGKEERDTETVYRFEVFVRNQKGKRVASGELALLV